MLKSFAKDTAIYGGINFFANFAIFAGTLIYARLLDISEFGFMALIIGIGGLVAGILHCGLANAMQRFYFDNGYDKQAIIHSTFALSSIIHVVGIGFILGMMFLIRDALPLEWQKGAIYFALAIAAFPFVAFTNLCLEFQRLLFNLKAYALVKTCTIVATPVVPLLFLIVFDQGLISVFQGMLAGSVMACLVLFLFLIKDFYPFKPQKNVMRNLFIFGYPFIFTTISVTIFNTIDKWMIVHFYSNYEVGIYTAAETVAKIVLFLSTAISMSWAPYALRLFQEDPQYKEKIVRIFNAAFAAMALFTLFIVIFAKEVVGIAMPSDYAPAALSASILAMGIIALFTQQMSALGISLEKRTGLISKGWIAALLVNIILNIIAIPLIGQLGAAITTTFCCLFVSGFFSYHSQKLHRFPLWLKSYVMTFVVLTLACIYAYAVDYMLDEHAIALTIALKLIGYGVCAILVFLQGFISKASLYESLKVLSVFRLKKHA